jgi:hypothetical protein
MSLIHAMFLNHLNSSAEHNVVKILHTLEHVHNFVFSSVDTHHLTNICEQYTGVKNTIVANSQFNSYHADSSYVKANLVLEAARLLLEIEPGRRSKKLKESRQPKDKSMPQQKPKSNAKPDFLDVDGDGNTKESWKKAEADRRAKKLSEKWDADMTTAKKDIGKWEGWTIADLKSRKNKLMSKDKRSAAEQKEVRQINFAIRAKQKDSWGKITETNSTKTWTVTFVDPNSDDSETITVRAATMTDARKKFLSDNPGSYIEKIALKEQTLKEDQNLEQAQALLAAKDISDRLQKMAEDAAKMSVDDLMPLVDTMKTEFGLDAADGFNSVVKAQLQSVLDTIIDAKDQTDNAINTLQSGGTPSAETDISMPLPADTSGLADDDAGADIDFEKEFAAMPATSGPTQEPMGRAKKKIDEVAGRATTAQPSSPRPAPVGTPVPGSTNINTDAQADEEEKVSEAKKSSRSPYAIGMSKAMELTGDKPPLKKSTIVKAHEIASAIQTMKESAKIKELDSTILSLLKEHRSLLKELDAHKKYHNSQLREGKAIDPLNVGYGLEGEAIIHKIQVVKSLVSEAKAKKHDLEHQIQNRALAESYLQEQIATIDQALGQSPYGVIGKLNSGKACRKFFENQQTRDWWLSMNQTELMEFKLVDPQMLQSLKKRLRRATDL